MDTIVPKKLSFAHCIIKICAGNYHQAALDALGNLYTWGFSANGGLLQSEEIVELVDPKMVKILKGNLKIVDFGCGKNFTVVVMISKNINFQNTFYKENWIKKKAAIGS